MRCSECGRDARREYVNLSRRFDEWDSQIEMAINHAAKEFLSDNRAEFEKRVFKYLDRERDQLARDSLDTAREIVRMCDEMASQK